MLRRSYVHERVCELSSSPLQLPVSTRFQILFQPPPGVLFSFPSRYLFTIDQYVYLALPHSRGRFPQDFTCPAVLRNYFVVAHIFQIQDYHLLWFFFPEDFPIYVHSYFRLKDADRCSPTTPHVQGSLPFSIDSNKPKSVVFPYLHT